jgi:hypothetical protein
VDVTSAEVKDPDCAVTTPLVEGEKKRGRVVAIADRVDLTTLDTKGLTVGMTNVPDAWLLDWARLFSQRIPAGERPGGTVAGSVLFAGGRKGWEGEFHGEVGGLPWKAVAVTAGEGGFVLTPFSLTLPGKAAGLMLSGTATRVGVSLRMVGSATEAQVAALRGMAPPVGDGVEKVLGKGDGVVKVDVTCSRAWGAGQSCVESVPVVAKRRRGR